MTVPWWFVHRGCVLLLMTCSLKPHGQDTKQFLLLGIGLGDGGSFCERLVVKKCRPRVGAGKGAGVGGRG